MLRIFSGARRCHWQMHFTFLNENSLKFRFSEAKPPEPNPDFERMTKLAKEINQIYLVSFSSDKQQLLYFRKGPSKQRRFFLRK